MPHVSGSVWIIVRQIDLWEIGVRKQQDFVYSCGAACLLCAASELGVTHLPVLDGVLCAGQPLLPTNNCERAIYQITSGAAAAPGAAARQDLENAKYSFPHNVVYAARVLGLSAEIYMESGFFSRALSYIYPKCIMLCERSGIPIHRTPAPALAPNQRLLRIVGVLKFVGLHYVMLRPPAAIRPWMDPADGQDFASFGAMNNSWLKSYSDTGISIVLSR